jgi:hypothetical protein
MRRSLCEFWKDERGSLLIAEWVFVATILMMGILLAALSIRSRIGQASTQLGTWDQINPIPSCGTEKTN